MSGSTARHPDLDWSQIRETILMLALSVAQIEMSMRGSDGSVEVLSNSFTSMMGLVKMIESVAAALPETAEAASAKAAIIESGVTVSEMMRCAIVAFQFYDKLTQRLGHVSGSMNVLADLIADQRRLYNPHEWMGMQEKIKSPLPWKKSGSCSTRSSRARPSNRRWRCIFRRWRRKRVKPAVPTPPVATKRSSCAFASAPRKPER